MLIDNKHIQQLRKEYNDTGLSENSIISNPIEQFKQWFEEALKANILEPNAMTLSTANKVGKPSARVVLLKGYDKDGFIWYTNYNSRKGQELIENPYAALTFCWLELQKQIRIEGKAEKIDNNLSDVYFASRPKGSQIGALASPQSSIISNRSILEDRVQQLNEQYKDSDQFPRPDHWGGFRLVPNYIEFWKGRASRLHDRIAYTLENTGDWRIERLAP